MFFTNFSLESKILNKKFLLYEIITITTLEVLEIIFIISTNKDVLFAAHIFILLRIPRCLHLLTYFKSFRDIASVIRKLMPFSYGLFSVLYIIFFCFSILGNRLWGGLIHSNVPLPE